jgi:hypothetical protein
MLVFAAHPSERLIFILNQILVVRLGLSYKLTDNPTYFEKSPSLRINYGTEIVEGCLNIPAINLLYEENIRPQQIEVIPAEPWHFLFFETSFQEIPDFRKHTIHLPFDILSASFYLLSRYEEYFLSKKDEHNRFKPEDSLACKQNFLQLPLVDIWLNQFALLLKKQYPELSFTSPKYTQLNTIDIDFAYKYKGLSFWQKSKKYLGSWLRKKPDNKALHPPAEDPYDTYDSLLKYPSVKNIKTYFFFLLADYGGHDKNIAPQSLEMLELINKLKQHNLCGIHPSYKAGINAKVYKQEHTLFEKLFHSKPILSRHHFLKIRLPESYEWMETLGIKNDYSLAYSSQVGFRASTCFPFQFFHLPKNKTLDIWVHSPCLMDVTLKNSLNLNPQEAIDLIKKLKSEVQKVNGEFISIWHNSSFDIESGWQDWDQVYQGLFE